MRRTIIKRAPNPIVYVIGMYINGISKTENTIVKMGCLLLLLNKKDTIAVANPTRNIIPKTKTIIVTAASIIICSLKK